MKTQPLSKRKRIRLRAQIRDIKCPVCRYKCLNTDRFGKVTCAYCATPYEREKTKR